MKKPKSTFLAILIVLLFTSILLGYLGYIHRQDKSSIEAIILKDPRFYDVRVTTKGIGIILQGHVKSDADLQALYSEINRIKRGRVDSAVSVSQ